MMRWFTALVCTAILGGSAIAQDAPSDEQALLFEDGAFVIKGKVQKPEVVVVITRDNLDKGFNLELKESFLPRIVEALDHPPFQPGPASVPSSPSRSR